jgi:arsenite-transporting ATPase
VRDLYLGRIDPLFYTLVCRGLDAAHDRAILRDLLALAPPGIDELYALASLGETLDERRYSRIIVDPAPTGHLLRLLEMPALALEWSHRLMRLILKYKDIAALGEAAEDLLAFSKRTRQLDALLRDPERAAVVLVMLDEPLVRAESLRLASALTSAGIAISGVITNRVQGTSPVDGVRLDARPQLVAPVSRAPLVGAAAIREWMREWCALTRFHPS